MNSFKFFVLVLSTLLFVSCGALDQGAGLTRTSTEYFKPTTPDSIEVFNSKRPSRDFIELGSIAISKYKYVLIFPTNKNPTAILNEMKAEAAYIGGNAIIDYRDTGGNNVSGTIIRYK